MSWIKKKAELNHGINERDHNNRFNERNNLKNLIANLEKDVEFLHKEIDSTNKIIEILVGDKHQSSINKVNLQNGVDTAGAQTRNANTNFMQVNNGNVNSEGCDSKFIEVPGRKRRTNKTSITLLGDSMIKGIEGYKMRQGMSSGERVFVRSFPGAKTRCMHDYSKPTLTYEPDAIVLHVGTNDLRDSTSAAEIGNEIIELAKEIKSVKNDVIVSGIILRNDSNNKKGNEVNAFLKSKCSENSFLYCDNSNISRNCLNGSGLHLNPKGTVLLANNFLECLNY